MKTSRLWSYNEMNGSSSSSSSASCSSSSIRLTDLPPQPSPPHPSSSHLPAHYTLLSHPAHTSSTPSHPLEPHLPPPGPSLREPPLPDILPLTRPTLTQFRTLEGSSTRASKLRNLWSSLPSLPECRDCNETETKRMRLPGQDTITALSPERAERLRKLYEEELVRRVGEKRPEARLWGGADDLEPDGKGLKGKGIGWGDFRRFLWDQERELWDTFQDLDKNGDGRLDATDLRAALSRSGLDLSASTVQDLVRTLACGSGFGDGDSGSGKGKGEEMFITFGEFRDFLIMLPRKATPFEIYKFYQVRKRFSDGRGAARVDKEGDINVSFPKAPDGPQHSTASVLFGSTKGKDKAVDDVKEVEEGDDFGDLEHEDEEPEVNEDRHEAWRFLLAGGIAGAVSRTVTAPFDRLKIYLITTTVDPGPSTNLQGGSKNPTGSSSRAVANLWGAMGKIYKDGGGLRAFWVGNGLNVTKIFPESAIKFVSYEQSKKFLAKYWDQVSDPSEISSASRFFAGGIGGITSQFSIYGLETLKTRVQSEVGPSQGTKQIMDTAKSMWRTGGIRAYYRGLTLGLIGVFPYSAIDMGTYETLKRAYCRSTGKDEPEVYAVLSFGALSGSIGAASVYPVNLLRTRLQASGSSGHPQAYKGFMDVLQQTLAKEGARGLYKGLLPSILKVGPAVGVSWIVYEDSKRRLGV